MGGKPGTSKGCTTCKRRKVRVSNLPPISLDLPKKERKKERKRYPLNKEFISVISSFHSALVAQIAEESARDMPKIGDRGLPKRLLSRLPIPESFTIPVTPRFMIIRSFLSFGKDTFPRPSRAYLMIHFAAGFSKSSLPQANPIPTP